ncbi:MAG: tyrosine-type recombinase/integrase [Aquabacterium sp.]|nr:tyrosine-type recombinase/integrase [Aquabacterium sp.]
MHGLGHSFAKQRPQDGCDIRAVQDLLGHADVATTMIFTHLLGSAPGCTQPLGHFGYSASMAIVRGTEELTQSSRSWLTAHSLDWTFTAEMSMTADDQSLSNCWPCEYWSNW